MDLDFHSEFALRISAQDRETIIEIHEDHIGESHTRQYRCKVTRNGEAMESRIDSQFVHSLRDIASHILIAPRGTCPMGIDGISYELGINNGFAQSRFHWWQSPGAAWEELEEIVQRLQHIARQCSGWYL